MLKVRCELCDLDSCADSRRTDKGAREWTERTLGNCMCHRNQGSVFLAVAPKYCHVVVVDDGSFFCVHQCENCDDNLQKYTYRHQRNGLTCCDCTGRLLGASSYMYYCVLLSVCVSYPSTTLLIFLTYLRCWSR